MLVLQILLRYAKIFNRMYSSSCHIKINIERLNVYIKCMQQNTINLDMLSSIIGNFLLLVPNKTLNAYDQNKLQLIYINDINKLIKIICKEDIISLLVKYNIYDYHTLDYLNQFQETHLSFMFLPYEHFIIQSISDDVTFSKFKKEYQQNIVRKLFNILIL